MKSNLAVMAAAFGIFVSPYPIQARILSAFSSMSTENFTSQLPLDITQVPSSLDDDAQDFAFQAGSAKNLESLFIQSTPVYETIFVKESTGLFVPACSDRSFWDAYSIPSFYVDAAYYFNANPMADWSDEAYLAFKATGDRQSGQDMMWARQVRLPYLVIAECKFYNGTFLNTIESDLYLLSKQRTWAYPSADWNLLYFNGTQYFMDLSSAAIASNLALALYLMNSQLSTETTDVVKQVLYTRVFNPLKNSFNGTAPWQWWVAAESNHVAVVWTGVLVAAFCVIENAEDRKFFVDKAIYFSPNYLGSFVNDGFASEGVGYYNYGFGNYALLRQTLYEGTNGTYDAFASPKAYESALFSKEFGISNNNAANFGDCHFDVFFETGIVRIIDRSFIDMQVSGFQIPNRADGLDLATYLPSLVPQNTPYVPGVTTPGMNSLRRYYNKSGVLTVRPNTLNDGQGLGGTFKLGGNKGGHSHNDIGSYVISVNSTKLAGDVGGPLYYDGNTFNSKRYDSPLMNSYGHPVPVVNGHLQSEAKTVLSKKSVKVNAKNFTSSVDSISFDLTGAYNEPNLLSLTRDFIYSRSESKIHITDTVNYSAPCMFEDALISKQHWTFTGNSSGYFSDGSEKLYVEVSSDAPFVMNKTFLSSYKVNFTRVGIYLLEPVIGEATVSFSFSSG